MHNRTRDILRQTLFVLVFLSMLAACSVTPSTPAPATAPTAKSTEVPTATPAGTAMEPTPAPATVPTAESTEAPTAMPTATPVALEPTAAPTTDSSASGTAMAYEHDQVAAPFNVSVAQYFLDSAGFHGMAETLSDTQKIDPAYLSNVTRVTKVLSQTTWPAELNDQAHEFSEVLNTFAAALTADKTQDAIEASDTVHDAQHELSHALDAWIATKPPLAWDAEPFNVSVAQYFMDTAGFHGMAEVLSDTKKIDATYLSTINRVNKVLSQTTWPPELNDQAQEFIGALNTFAAALEADNVDGAIEASDVVHDAQHELSHALDAWIATKPALAHDADPFKVSVAQYFLDSAGFHGMAEVLSDTQKIDSTYLSTVSRVNKVLLQTTWPPELNDQAQSFIVSLGDFAKALGDDNVDTAIEVSDVVHDTQHELSHAIDGWLGSAHAH